VPLGAWSRVKERWGVGDSNASAAQEHSMAVKGRSEKSHECVDLLVVYLFRASTPAPPAVCRATSSCGRTQGSLENNVARALWENAGALVAAV